MSDARRRSDPVCGMAVSPGDEADRVEHEGTDYLFCSTDCAENLRVDPPRHPTDPGASEDANASKRDGPKDAIYTCPMHPEVRQVGPGDCPKCGMALEPVDAITEQDDSELRDRTRRFWLRPSSRRRCSPTSWATCSSDTRSRCGSAPSQASGASSPSRRRWSSGAHRHSSSVVSARSEPCSRTCGP